jgi:hypothetical protein
VTRTHAAAVQCVSVVVAQLVLLAVALAAVLAPAGAACSCTTHRSGSQRY